MSEQEKYEDRERRRPSRVLMLFHILFLIIAFIVVGRIIYIQWIWEPNPKYVDYFRPSKHKEVIEPQRGSILDHNGRLLAISTPLYDIYMDCYVQKEANAKNKNKAKGQQNEKEWMEKAELLSQGLAEVLQEEGKDPAYYLNRIKDGRANKKRYVRMASGIDHGTLLELKKLPLFKEPQRKGGEKINDFFEKP